LSTGVIEKLKKKWGGKDWGGVRNACVFFTGGTHPLPRYKIGDYAVHWMGGWVYCGWRKRHSSLEVMGRLLKNIRMWSHAKKANTQGES